MFTSGVGFLRVSKVATLGLSWSPGLLHPDPTPGACRHDLENGTQYVCHKQRAVYHPESFLSCISF